MSICTKILYFTSYFLLFKYMVSFSRYFTVCITYQPPLVYIYIDNCVMQAALRKPIEERATAICDHQIELLR